MPIGVDIIPHRLSEEIIKKIDQLRITGYVAVNTEIQMLSGSARVGKSVLIRRYAEAHPIRETEDGLVRPVVMIEAPGKGKTKPLAAALLTELGDPHPSRGTETTMMTRAKHLVKEQKTELIIIDEVHDAMQGDLYEAADFFKHISNWNLCPLLLVGLPYAIDYLKTNEQLRGRARPVIDMKPFDWFDGAQKKAFRRILSTFQGMLSEEITSIPLSDEPIAARVHYGTGGALGWTTRLLRNAEDLAREREDRKLTLDVLAEAYESFQSQEPEDLRRQNPFKLKDLPERWSLLPSGGNAAAAQKLRRPGDSRRVGVG